MHAPSFFNFVITTFALLNPLGVLPIFVGYTAQQSLRVHRLVSLFVSLTVLVLLLVFLFLGGDLLAFLGVSLNAFRIAGGILLMLMGLNIVAGEQKDATAELVSSTADQSDLRKAQSVYQKIVIPMAMPLLVGPGVIANVILYGSKHERSLSVDGEFVVGVFALAAIVLAIFVAGRWVQEAIGPIALNILMRVMGLMVAAMGVQFMVTGVTEIVLNRIVPALR